MNKQEAIETLKRGKPEYSEGCDIREYLDRKDEYNNALDFLIDEKYDMKEMKKIFKISEKVDIAESKMSEEAYTEFYYEQKDKVEEIIRNAVNKRLEEIERLENEIERLGNFGYSAKRSLETLRIHYQIEISDEIEKGKIDLEDDY